MSIGFEVKKYNTIDVDSGEIGLISKTKRISNNERHIKLFIHDIGSLYGLSGATNDVLLQLYTRLDYSGETTITSVDRQRLVLKSKNISNKNYISTLLKGIQDKGLIKKIGENVYKMNPDIFAIGKQSDINKLREQYIKLQVIYSKNGRVISARIENK